MRSSFLTILICAAKQEPDRGFPQAQTAHDNFWDFISLMPELMHMVMWIMSDRTIPRSFGDVLDPTKLIPEEVIPVRIVGRMVLDRNPDNFFAETEQSAFCPANIVPGVDFSNDPLLQGRLFSYLDTQNRGWARPTSTSCRSTRRSARWPTSSATSEIQMMVPKGRANYEPNIWPRTRDRRPARMPSHRLHHLIRRDRADETGEKLRIRAERFADHYSQARLFWISQTESEQAHIASSFVFELSKTNLAQVQPRMVANLRNVDEDLAKRVAAGLGIDLPRKDRM